MNETIERVFSMLYTEFQSSEQKWGKFRSEHEGYALILEELDELWDEIKTRGNYEAKTMEAIHVAAMALHFIVDLVPPRSIPFLENILEVKERESRQINSKLYEM